MSRRANLLPSGLLAGGTVSALRIAGALLSLLLMALVSNQLGPDGAGRFYLSLTWAMTLAVAANWGAPGVLLVVMAPLAQGRRRPFAAALLSRFMLSGLARLALIALLLALPFLVLRGYFAAFDVAFALVLAPLIMAQQQLASTAKALHRPIAASALEFCLVPAFAATAYLALPAGTGIGPSGSFPELYAAGTAISVALLAALAANDLGVSRPARRSTARPFASRAQSFAHAEFAQYLTNWGALMLTPLFLSQADVGLLNAALRIAGTVSLVAIVTTVLIPRLAVARAANDAAGFDRLQRPVRLLMATSAAVLFAGMVFLGPLILGFMGAEFAPAYSPMLVAGAGFCAALALGPVVAVLVVQGRERLVRDVTVAVGFGTLVLSLPAMHLFGLAGAAAITGLGAFAQKFVLVLCSLRDPPPFKMSVD